MRAVCGQCEWNLAAMRTPMSSISTYRAMSMAADPFSLPPAVGVDPRSQHKRGAMGDEQ
jgi:hypothetical protein